MATVSASTKKVMDVVLSIAGLIVTTLASNAAGFPSPYNLVFSVAGVPGGYLISDLVGVVDSGKLPSASQIVQQVATTWADVKPLVQAQIQKISNPTEKALIQEALTIGEQQLSSTQAKTATTPTN